MLKIQFYDQSTPIEASFSIANNIVQLIGENITPNTSGFKVLSDYGRPIGLYPNYTTIYRVVDGGYQFSNDESVYVPPVIPDPVEPTEPEEPVGYQEPSLGERVELCENCLFELAEVLFS